MRLDPAQAKPGCFGSSLCYQAATLLCGSCPLREECAPLAAEMATRMRDKYGLTNADLERSRKAGRIARRADDGEDENEEAGEAGLSVKADKLVRRIKGHGIDLPRCLARGINPFEEMGLGYMRVLMDLALAGPFTRAQAREALLDRLGWAEASVLSHLSFGLQALVYLGALELEDGLYQRERVMA